MKNIFIINGMGGCGKDTFVSLINEIVPTKHISIVEPVKEVAKTLGWTGAKTDADRRFLYELKAALDHYKDSNYAYVRDVVEKFNRGELDCKVLCIDMREEYQVERARKEFDARVVLVTRDEVKFISTNFADANVFTINYDIIVNNNGTIDDLKKVAEDFVKDYVSV